MLKSSFIITILFILSAAVQLVSQIIVTRLFGASYTLDTYLAAVAIPTIIVTLIYSSVNNVLVPFFAHYKSKGDDVLLMNLYNVLICLFVVSSVITVLAILNANSLSALFFKSRGDVFVADVSLLMKYLFLGIPVATTAAVLGAYTYVNKQLTRFPIAQLLGSVANIIIIYLMYEQWGMNALVWAFILNMVFQILYVVPFEFPKKISFDVSYLGPLLISWLPLLISDLILKSDTLLIRVAGSELSAGSLVYLNLISKICSIAAGVVTIGIQVVLLPHLVEDIENKKTKQILSKIFKAKIGAIILALGVVVSIVIIGPFAIKLLFEGGKFTALDVQASLSLIPYFIIPTIGWGISGVFFQPLYAFKRYKELLIITIMALIFSWGGLYFLLPKMDVLIALSVGLNLLLFTGIIGSEIVWQIEKKNLVTAQK